MTAQQLWDAVCARDHLDGSTPFEAWAFGGAPDVLADLVLAGIKTGTASGYALYELDASEPIPRAGDYSVILNSRNEAVCVIRTTRVYAVPYRDVTAEHAYKEGEGDRSLSYWRQVHWDFFTREYSQYGLVFTEDSAILCEEFEMVYRPEVFA